MKTEKMKVSADGKGREEAINEAEEFATSVGLSGKYKLRFRLLAEEVLGMLQGIVADFTAIFYMEEKEGTYYITIEADADMDRKKRKDLMAVSTSGKNESAKGIMGKVREFFTKAIDHYEEIDSLVVEYGGENMGFNYGTSSMNEIAVASYLWSLNQYYKNLEKAGEQTSEKLEEAYDELEKSIVANLADDIRVGIRGDKVSVILETCADTIRTTKKLRKRSVVDETEQ